MNATTTTTTTGSTTLAPRTGPGFFFPPTPVFAPVLTDDTPAFAAFAQGPFTGPNGARTIFPADIDILFP